MKRVNRVGIFLLTWTPILWSGATSLFEGFGYGLALRWHSPSAWGFWIGLWVVGAVVWVMIVRWLDGVLTRRFGF